MDSTREEKSAGRETEPAKRTSDDPPRLHFPEQVYYVHSFAMTALLILAAVYTLYIAADIFIPIIIAFVLYLLLAPLLRVLEKLHVPTTLAAALIVVGLVAALVAAVYWLSSPVAQWVGRMPQVLVEVSDKVEALRRPVEEAKEATEQVEQMTEVGDGPRPQQVVLQSPGLMERLFGNAAEIAVQLLLILVLLYFLLATGQIFREKLVMIMPTFGDKKRAVAITNEIQRHVSRYLLTITLINTGLGIAIGTALYAVGMPSAFLWGVMATVLNFIPYIGAIVGFAIVGLVALITFDTLSDALIPPLVYMALTSLEGQIVTPSVLGRSLTLNPLVIFIVVIFWGWIWGVPGALLAVPMLVVFKAICDHIETWAPIGEFISGRRP